ncbi:predicted protein [Naegleria gruberi]|uniref:Predicted protein n=1 Tax=Naegleria gruberi TaxID=5762 RepID=D2VW12_NAEGR|nr:uncharacterized protein NAEGRDRAFT_73211 [Naegleria gruberi]EFC38999.1 predicted protein [Naegleria gruberi]|eukprot:XP_002671743.1 predicted protein [Naegleria gruberi strain NEG-M]
MASTDNMPIALLFERGFSNLYAKGKFKEAADYFDKILDISPNHIEALYHKGVTHYVSANFSEAIKVEEKVLQLDPKHRWAYVIKGNAFNERGEFKKAMETFQKCIAMTNRSFDVVYNALGNCYFLQEDFNSSLETYNKAIALAIDNFTVSTIHPDDHIFNQMSNDHQLARQCENILTLPADEKNGSVQYLAPNFGNVSPVEERYKRGVYDRFYLLRYSGACLTILNKGLTLLCLNRFSEALDCFLLIIQVTYALMGKEIFRINPTRLDPARISDLIELLQNKEYTQVRNNPTLAYDSRTSYCIAYSGIGVVCEAMLSRLYSTCHEKCTCSSDHHELNPNDVATDINKNNFCTRKTINLMNSVNRVHTHKSLAELFFDRADDLIEDSRMKREVLYFKGEGLRHIRHYQKAIDNFECGLQMNSLEIRSMIGVGRVAIAVKDYKAARQIFKKIINITNYEHPIAMSYLEVVKMSAPILSERSRSLCDVAICTFE